MKSKIEALLKIIEKKVSYPSGKMIQKIEQAKTLIAYNDDSDAMIRIFGELQLIYKQLDPKAFKRKRYIKKLKK